MSEASIKKPTDSNVVAKAGLWFTISNFIFRGMAFFTVPIFTRLLTKVELGTFSNISSWIGVLMVLTSMDMSVSIIRSKVEHEDDIDCYIISILSLSTIVTVAFYIFALLNQSFVLDFLEVTDVRYIHLMFLYFFTTPAYSMLITKHRAFFKYKLFALLTAVVTVASIGLSVVMVLTMEDKLWGRTIGQYIPSIIMGAVIYVYLIYKGKRIKLEYWKYALVMCVPLVPQSLSATLLSSSDRITLTQFCGTEMTAIFSVAGSCYHIATILMDSLNKAWTPWLFENLHSESYDRIKSFSKRYILVFFACVFGVMLVGPELVWIFGGSRYRDATYSLLPLLASCIIQFIYLFYVNVEFYTKKTVMVAVATAIAASTNILLDIILLPLFPKNGYVLTAYTTLASYFLLLVLHYCIVRHRGLAHVFDTKVFVMVVLAAIASVAIISLLYQLTVVRYIISLILGCAAGYLVIKNRSLIVNYMKKKK